MSEMERGLLLLGLHMFPMALWSASCVCFMSCWFDDEVTESLSLLE